MANLKDLAQVLTQYHMNRTAGDFMTRVTYKSKGVAGYDTETGQVIPGNDQEFSVPALISAFSSTPTGYADTQRDDDPVLSIDRKILIAGLNLPVIPKIGDQIVAPTSLYRVVEVSSDPATAAWKLHVRKLAQI